MISILGDYNYTFPKPIPLKLKLKDMLEDNVDEKYYLSDKMINCFMSESENSKFPKKERFFQTLKTTNEDGIAATLCTTGGTRCTDNFITNKSLKETLEQNKIDDTCYIDTYNKRIDKDKSGTITTGVSFRNNTFLAIKNATQKGYLEATDGDGIDLTQPNSETRRGRVQKEAIQTLTTQNNLGVVSDLRIRKLTPRECFRLMGVKDEDFDKVRKNQSDSSLYHLAGDSICVPCLMALFSQLLDIKWEDK